MDQKQSTLTDELRALHLNPGISPNTVQTRILAVSEAEFKRSLEDLHKQFKSNPNKETRGSIQQTAQLLADLSRSKDILPKIKTFTSFFLVELLKDLNPDSVSIILYLLHHFNGAIASDPRFANLFVIGDYLCTGKFLGKGSYAEVFQGKHVRANFDVAIKKMDTSRLQPNVLRLLNREVEVMKSVSHSNVVQLYDAQRNRDHLYLVLEFCSGDSLEACMNQKPVFSEKSIKHIISQMVDGLHYLHRQNIVHRDLKPANILVNKADNKSLHIGEDDYQVKIADFTFARYIEPDKEFMDSCLGTPLYMAPEIFLTRKYKDNSDLWSLGVILYQLMYQRLPIQPRVAQMHHLVEAIKTHQIECPSQSYSPDLLSLVKSLLQKDPERRITWKALLDHPFIAQKEEDDKQYTVLREQYQGIQQSLANTKESIAEMQARLQRMGELRARLEALRAEKENIQELKHKQDLKIEELGNEVSRSSR